MQHKLLNNDYMMPPKVKTLKVTGQPSVYSLVSSTKSNMSKPDTPKETDSIKEIASRRIRTPPSPPNPCDFNENNKNCDVKV